MEKHKFIQDCGSKEEVEVWELFHNNPKLQSVTARRQKSGELKGKIILTVKYND
jgi:hypothetical protein